ncbi:hemerythrin domain-containing protein [Motiliproteus sediminis]|uniref:hemerythrin domain-containing protein n=1 Tax=Motiliproteus sediminis TaxID=1468178 RepID=UPI001AF01E90|nr:hemerythrin domain-containing protein [Motiliproteus sediminis]
MGSIQTYMTAGHRQCDDSYTSAENAVSAQNWSEADSAWQQFATELEHHLGQEEQLLFPAFEQQTGNTQGPTAVMRMEHEQMRALVADLSGALQARDSDRFLGLGETLMVLMQQHNMKEEQILYPMTDQVIGNSSELVTRLDAF